MQAYRVTLVRSYIITVLSEGPSEAGRLAEFFMGHSDVSTPVERETLGFSIEDIEMVENDSIEVKSVDSVAL